VIFWSGRPVMVMSAAMNCGDGSSASVSGPAIWTLRPIRDGGAVRGG
jgi:hypothetical protein